MIHENLTATEDLASRTWTGKELMRAAFLELCGFRVPCRPHEGPDLVRALLRKDPSATPESLRRHVTAYMIGSERASELWRGVDRLRALGPLTTRQVVDEVVELLLALPRKTLHAWAQCPTRAGANTEGAS